MSTNLRTHEEFNSIPIAFGCDPELFLFDTKADKYISGHGIIPGTKKEPHYFDDGGSCQLDGVACEIGVPPSYNERDFIFNLKSTLKEVKKLLPKDVELRATPTAWFDEEYFDKEVPESCKELGCDPDFDAYKNGAPNPRPNGRVVKNGKVMRTGAGHIHISWGDGFDTTSDSHRWDCIQLTKSLDAVFKTFVPQWDKDTTRMQMYGAPGTFRPKKYGLEYRTPSNAWLADEKYARSVYSLARLAMWFTFQTGKDVSAGYYDHIWMRNFNFNVNFPSYTYIGNEVIYPSPISKVSGKMF